MNPDHNSQKWTPLSTLLLKTKNKHWDRKKNQKMGVNYLLHQLPLVVVGLLDFLGCWLQDLLLPHLQVPVMCHWCCCHHPPKIPHTPTRLLALFEYESFKQETNKQLFSENAHIPHTQNPKLSKRLDCWKYCDLVEAAFDSLKHKRSPHVHSHICITSHHLQKWARNLLQCLTMST
jgi:hypothetical protein